MEFASLEANLGGGRAWGLLVYPILFSLPLSGRSPSMTETLLTGTLSLNSLKVPLSQISAIYCAIYLKEFTMVFDIVKKILYPYTHDRLYMSCRS